MKRLKPVAGYGRKIVNDMAIYDWRVLLPITYWSVLESLTIAFLNQFYSNKSRRKMLKFLKINSATM